MPEGNAGWSDAAVITPYLLWQEYGNTRVISDQWESLERYMQYLERRTLPTGLTAGLGQRVRVYVAPGQTYGHWLNVDDETSKELISTAYLAHSADLMARMARATGEADDASRYQQLFEDVRSTFNTLFVGPDGAIVGNTQTSYVMALSMDLLPESKRAAAADRLVASIKARGMHLSTGFLGTAKLLPVLTSAGHSDIAYALIQQTTYPSWGYQIEQGATTIWEHWDSTKPDGSFESPVMNSWSHYGIGGVGEWMYGSIGGIGQDPQSPGYKHFVVRPVPGGGLTRVDASHQSPYGTIVSRWTDTDRAFQLHVEVPVNTTATISVPAEDTASVTIDVAGTASPAWRMATQAMRSAPARTPSPRRGRSRHGRAPPARARSCSRVAVAPRRSSRGSYANVLNRCTTITQSTPTRAAPATRMRARSTCLAGSVLERTRARSSSASAADTSSTFA